jgi:CheY-like chemotaxis protein
VSQIRRILIVEDKPYLLASYSENLNSVEGFSADKAITREEALELIRRKAYHAAMIDINLTDFSGVGGDRSGIEIVKAINKTGEGTNCVVVSGEKGSEAPVDAFDAGIYKYIIKDRLVSSGDYLPIVSSAARESELNMFGNFKDLGAYLARPRERFDWDSQMMTALKCDARALSSITSRAFRAVLPVLRGKGGSASLILNSTGDQVSGAFWSRALGSPVWVCLGRKGSILDAPQEKFGQSELLDRHEHGPENFAVWRLSSPTRDDFNEFAFDVV